MTTDSAPKPGPLTGIRIIDMSSVVLGPFATLILSDLGAEVIKIEAPGSRTPGDIMRYAGESPTGDLGPLFMALNRNKSSVVLDVKTPEGKAALTELLRGADVFFHNVRMAGMERLGFGYDAVQDIRKDMIYVHCAGFGAGGAYESRQAYDDLIQAASGYASLYSMRSPQQAPSYSPSLLADKTTGLFAAYATLAALLHRERSGEGQFVQVPMLECFTFFNMVENLYGETFIPGNGKYAYTRSINPRRRPYPTLDGHIAIVPYNDAQWQTFFEIGGRPGVFEDPRFSTYQARSAHTGELYGIIEEVAATKTTEDWLTLLDEANIPVMRFNEMKDVTTDPHLESVGFFQERIHETAGKYRSMRHPVHFSKSPASVRSEPRQLGADTETTLAALGLASDTL